MKYHPVECFSGQNDIINTTFTSSLHTTSILWEGLHTVCSKSNGKNSSTSGGAYCSHSFASKSITQMFSAKCVWNLGWGSAAVSAIMDGDTSKTHLEKTLPSYTEGRRLNLLFLHFSLPSCTGKQSELLLELVGRSGELSPKWLLMTISNTLIRCPSLVCTRVCKAELCHTPLTEHLITQIQPRLNTPKVRDALIHSWGIKL